MGVKDMSYVKYIESKDGTLLYNKVQTQEEPELAKGTIVIVHGLAEHLGRYDDFAGTLIRSGFNVIRYDQRGHGHSSGEETFYLNHDEMTDDLGAIIISVRNHFQVHNLFLINYSIGGHIVALYYTKYPGNIDCYITSGDLTHYNHELYSVVPRGLGISHYLKNELG